MSIEADFDALVIAASLTDIVVCSLETEIHSMAYLAQLLSVYDGQPASCWGYGFTHHRLGGPYALDLAAALQRLAAYGYVEEKQTTLGAAAFEVTESGIMRTKQLTVLGRLRTRVPYISSACDVALGRPLPHAVLALQAEPLLRSALQAKRTEQLLPDSPATGLYEQFELLKSKLAPRTLDLWIVALAWVDYLKEQGMGEL